MVLSPYLVQNFDGQAITLEVEETHCYKRLHEYKMPSHTLQICSECFTKGKRDGARVRVLTPNKKKFEYLVSMSFNLGFFLENSIFLV